MEQIKLLESFDLNNLETQVNEFLSTLDEHTDIIDIRIDKHFGDSSTVFSIYTLIATIRFATYKNEDKDPEKCDPTADLVKYMENGYPLESFDSSYDDFGL